MIGGPMVGPAMAKRSQTPRALQTPRARLHVDDRALSGERANRVRRDGRRVCAGGLCAGWLRSTAPHAMPAPRARQRCGRPAPLRSCGRPGVLLGITRGRRGELAAGGDAELAVDVARVGTNRLDSDLQGEGYLSVRATLLEQRKHFRLPPGQQLPRDRGARTRRHARNHLKPPGGEVDRAQ